MEELRRKKAYIREPETQRAVSREEGVALANEHGCLFLECSARTRENVEQCFEELALKVSLKGEGLGLYTGDSSLWMSKPTLPMKQPLIWYKAYEAGLEDEILAQDAVDEKVQSKYRGNSWRIVPSTPKILCEQKGRAIQVKTAFLSANHPWM